MNQCVPSWDIENNPAPPRIALRAHSNSIPASLDYEVAELTWENGQIAMHGLGTPRVVNKAAAATSSTWEKRSSGGTLESLVNQATCLPHTKSATGGNLDELVPWFNHHRAIINPAASGGGATMTMDALVPCNNLQDQSTHVQEYAPGTCTCVGGCSTGVGSCNPAAMDGGARGGRVARVGISGRKTNMSLSVSESATCGGEDSRQVTLDTCDLGGAAFTSTSPDNTSSGKENTGDDHDSVCHSRSQRKRGAEEGKKKGIIGKSSVSTKRGRAAAIHNQSERKRRDKINQRMKTLQKMVPNSSKTDKASMLDEVIEYLKQLQAQVHMMSRMSMPSMMLPLAMQQQQIQMSMMGMQMGMGMGMGMDMNSTTRAAMPPVMSPAAPFMPWENPNYLSSRAISDPMNAFLACQSHPMSNNVDAYARLAAMYQHIQQNPGSGPTN